MSQRAEILVVHDDDVFASTLAEALAVHGLTVHREASSADAIRRVVGGTIPFLVLLKSDLPGLPVPAVAMGMRGTPGMQWVPVVLIGPEGDGALAALAARAAAHGHLPTPVRARELIAWMHAHIEAFPMGTRLPPIPASAPPRLVMEASAPPAPPPPVSGLPAMTPSGKAIPASLPPPAPGLPAMTPSGKPIPVSAPPPPPGVTPSGKPVPVSIPPPAVTPSGKAVPPSMPPPRPGPRGPLPAMTPSGKAIPDSLPPPPPGIRPPAERVEIPVLLVDNDDASLARAEAALAGQGYAIRRAKGWDGFMAEMTSAPVAIVVIEVAMAGVNDDHLALFQDGLLPPPDPRILLFSGLSEGELAQLVVELGATGYVTKAGPDERLRDAVRNAALGYAREKNSLA